MGSTNTPPNTEDHENFKGVMQAELEALRPEGNLQDGPMDAAHQAGLSGLAFSGGGIRSATFNLGVLQGLARMGILYKFDYLSTVSGGGYIGAWLTAWLHRAVDEQKQKTKAPEPANQGQEQVRAALGESFPDREMTDDPAPITHLREFANYLTPRLGLWSTDTWTLIASYVRNLVLTLPIVLGAILATLLLTLSSMILYGWMLAIPTGANSAVMYGLFFIPLSGAICLVAMELKKIRNASKNDIEAHYSLWPARIAVALFLAALWFGAALVWYHSDTLLTGGPIREAIDIRFMVIWGPLFSLAAFSVLATIVVGIAGRDLGALEREWLMRLLALSGKLTLLYSLFAIVLFYTPLALRVLNVKLDTWYGGVLGALWAAVSFAGAKAGQIGQIAESKWGHTIRNVLSVIAPATFIFGLLVLLVAVLDTDPIHSLLFDQAKDPNMVPGWFNRSTLSLKAFRNHTIAGAGMFLLTFLWAWRVGVNAFSLHALYGNRLIRTYLGASNTKRNSHPFTGFDPNDNEVRMSDLVPGQNGYKGPYPIINGTINLTQTKRLAWQQRKAGAFTFSPLFCGYQFPESAEPDCKKGYVASRLYGAGRRSKGGITLGKAMTISGAAACPSMGYHSAPALAFLMTVFNVRLGWWLPNTGITKETLWTRLARWFKIPLGPQPPETGQANRRLWAKEGPSAGLIYLLYELFGMTHEKRNYVYISDGGHFENLGIYELVRRRCRFVLACDAEADEKMQFTGLGIAIERCRTDFGIQIDIDVAPLHRDKATGLSRRHCAVGKIRYSQLHPGMEDGVLLYVKASLGGHEPRDIATYAAEHPSFPHQTTVDQWFDEMQFESYRTLGLHIITRVMNTSVEVTQRNADAMALARGRGRDQARSGSDTRSEEIKNNLLFMEALSRDVTDRWSHETVSPEKSPDDFHTELGDLIDTLRREPLLKFLDCQLHPNLAKNLRKLPHERKYTPWVPADYPEMRAGFFFCCRLIRFMAQVHHGLDLDAGHDTPSLRGWMNLFRQWALSRMVRYTWALSAGTYSKRFQTFCAHHLRLDGGDLIWGDKPLRIRIRSKKSKPDQCQSTIDKDWRAAESRFELNFYESQLACEFVRSYYTALKRKQHKASEKQRIMLPTTFELFPLRVTTEDPTSVIRDQFIFFTVGFAIAAAQGGKKSLLYLRIRPEMRHMGLARKALDELTKGLEQLPAQVASTTIRKIEPTKEHWHRRIYLELYPMQHQSKGRQYMARMFNRKIALAARRRDKETATKALSEPLTE